MTYATAQREVQVIGGHPVRVTSIPCCDCGSALSIRAPNGPGTLPDQVMHKKAMRQGWTEKRGKYTCPCCRGS
jgi:hypothetical protein